MSMGTAHTKFSSRQDTSGSQVAEIAICHLVEIAAGSCTITPEIILAENDAATQEVLAGLLTLHEDLVYKEAVLSERMLRFEAVFNNSPVGIVTLDVDGVVLSCNTSFLDFIGSTSPSLTGQSLLDVLHSSDRDKVASSIVALFRTELSQERLESQFVLPDGVVKYANIVLGGLCSANGEVGEVLAMVVDNTERKSAERKIQALNFDLTRASRLAGMAEVATTVLHNVGNVLNSIGVSVELAAESFGDPKLMRLRQALELMETHVGGLDEFLVTDERGKRLLPYMTQVVGALVSERDKMQTENKFVYERLNHIKTIVKQQQQHARPVAIVERCAVWDLVDDALMLATASYSGHQIELVRIANHCTDVTLDRHRVLQILVNLLANAEDAVVDSDATQRRITVEHGAADNHQFYVRVGDNGVGIDAKNLGRIFAHGFTTKNDGHGFGLHDSANAAQAMGGQLSCVSDGEGKGATFVLQLPIGSDLQKEVTSKGARS